MGLGTVFHPEAPGLELDNDECGDPVEVDGDEMGEGAASACIGASHQIVSRVVTIPCIMSAGRSVRVLLVLAAVAVVILVFLVSMLFSFSILVFLGTIVAARNSLVTCPFAG